MAEAELIARLEHGVVGSVLEIMDGGKSRTVAAALFLAMADESLIEKLTDDDAVALRQKAILRMRAVLIRCLNYTEAEMDEVDKLIGGP